MKDLEKIQALLATCPVLFTGAHGNSKTYDANVVADAMGCNFITIQGHDGLDSTDILGFMTRIKDGSYIWVDGLLSKAFRLASQGLPCLVFIDEILRIPSRTLSIFLAALTPVKGSYILNTGRVTSIRNDIGETETLKAPLDKLFFIAATNIGAEYDVNRTDPAFMERWLISERINTNQMLLEIMTKELMKKTENPSLTPEFLNSKPEDFANALLMFHDKMSSDKREGKIQMSTSLRTLLRIIQIAKNLSLSCDDSGLQQSGCLYMKWSCIEEAVLLMLPMWVKRDPHSGKLIDSQKQLIEGYIKIAGKGMP